MNRETWAVAATLLLLMFGMTQALGQPLQHDMQPRMQQRMQACTPCHGKEGRATPEGYFPRIAGKPAGYLAAQLQNFRDGRRPHALMTNMVRHLSDDYIADIAAYFAAQDLPYSPPVTPPFTARAKHPANAGVLARGRHLAEQGDTERRLPACQACHGAALMGVQPQVPGLLGLPRDYLLAQLGAWRTGQRRTHAPDCMAQVAKALSDHDASAVATWLATQTVQPGIRTATQTAHARDLALAQAQAQAQAKTQAQTLPLRCAGMAP